MPIYFVLTMRSLRIVTQALVAVEYMYRDQEEIARNKQQNNNDAHDMALI